MCGELHGACDVDHGPRDVTSHTNGAGRSCVTPGGDVASYPTQLYFCV
jgi:hypothetical protein